MADHSDIHQPPAQAQTRLFWVLLLIALVVGAGIRLYGLNGGSLWIDELYTVRDACDMFEEGRRPTRWVGYIPTAIVLKATGMDSPTITWENLHTWKAAGLEPWHMRLGPALLGILSILILPLALRRATRDSAIAGVFAILLAFAPWHLFWSQLGRYYTLKFLLVGLVFAWYYRGTRHGEKKYVPMACAALFLAYLVHPPALGLGAVFLIDIGLSYLRKNPLRIGVAGWIAAILTAVVAVGLFFAEKALWPAAFEPFVGDKDVGGQSAPLVFAGAFYMLQLPLLVAAGAAVFAMRSRGDEHQSGVYWFIAGLLPIVLMAGLSLVTFSLARYAFDSLFGFLVLASIAVVYAWRALEPKFGKVFAAAPCLMILASNAMLIAQFHTTGNHLHRDWVSAFEYVLEHREPGDKIVSQRPEIATYYLGEVIEQDPPSARFIIDRYAEGSPVWVVDLGSSSITDHRWKNAPYAELHGVYPIRVWQPYSEIHVYRYLPRPREQWEPEEREAEARRAGENS